MSLLIRLRGLLLAPLAAAKLLKRSRREPASQPPAMPAPGPVPEVTPRAVTGEGTPPTTDQMGPTGPLGPRRRRQRNLIVGIDFGTSTTKVVWQDMTENAFEVFRWSLAPGGGAVESALLPTMLAVRDRQVWLGNEAVNLKDPERRIPWIKVCVLCEKNPAICRDCRHSNERSRVSLGHSATVSARALACHFLSHVIATVENHLTDRFSGEELNIHWNVGCPMDQVDSLQARERYEAMVYLAWDQRSGASNPAPVDLVSRLEECLKSVQVPAERVVHVRPETHAGVMAFLQSPHAEERTYVIVDVGAGTTEVSMFIHGRNRTELGHPFVSSYLGDGTFPVGGGDIDRELAKFWGVETEEARKRKERGDPLPNGIKSVENIFASYRSVCVEVAQRRMLVAPHDLQYDLFAFGGGSRLKSVQAALQRDLRHHPLRLARIEQVRPPRMRQFDGLEQNFDLLALACGLSSTLLDWDRINPPSDTPPLPPTLPRSGRPDRDELYPK